MVLAEKRQSSACYIYHIFLILSHLSYLILSLYHHLLSFIISYLLLREAFRKYSCLKIKPCYHGAFPLVKK